MLKMTRSHSDSNSRLFKAACRNDISVFEEKGSVLVEASIAMMFLATVFLGVVSMANILLPYLKLTQIADEALRTLSAIPSLESGEFKSSFTDDSIFKSLNNDIIQTCSSNPRSSQLCGHLLAKRRVQFLFRTLDIGFIDISKVEILTERDTTNGTVHVKITGPHTGLFLDAFEGLPITVEAQGSYLF